ncbi:hypothetical protein JTE90_020907 [Oedothorax gibbosus]|uniref:Uncharacterized protein n=1 Tax=Oedothorax gibbosus TaxID=931172 RepID=A0AAV6VQG6_9ARAC|nr:hypothetical protein JTE90_020907 [Oedothorax gibbosus]
MMQISLPSWTSTPTNQTQEYTPLCSKTYLTKPSIEQCDTSDKDWKFSHKTVQKPDMRQSRGTGPPSTQSGSSSSGRGLVRGSHRSRGLDIPGVMVPGDPEKEQSKNRTRVIVILGIALPVLACIIGIIAWSVTTDVLRISPRSHDNAFNRFGHQGKTRIDTLQPRNDAEDVDIFQFHSITSPSPTAPSVKVFTRKPQTRQPNKATAPTTMVNHKTTTDTPNVSDILSRLISDMPVNKNQKNFVVFAPVADALQASDPSKDRKFDGKTVTMEDDLEAQESSYSEEEVRQDGKDQKVPFSRKRKSSVEGLRSDKIGRMLVGQALGVQVKPNAADRSVWEDSAFKNKSSKIHHMVPGGGISSQSIPSKNNVGSIENHRSNIPQHFNSDSLRTHGAKPPDIQTRGNINIGSKSVQQQVPLHFNDIKKNGFKHGPPNVPSSNSQTLPSEDKGGIKRIENGFHISDIGNSFQQQASYQIQHPLGISRTKPFPMSSQGHVSSPNFQQQQLIKNSQRQNINPLHQNLHNAPLPLIQNLTPQQSINQLLQSNINSPNNFHATRDNNPHSSSTNVDSSFQTHILLNSAPSHSTSNQGPSGSATNKSPVYPGSSYPVDNGYQSSNNGPKYYAPPPQTFHTKANYELPSNNHAPSLSTYEIAAQTTLDKLKEEVHHHHHHHHHHEPIPSSSDQIGDINLSDVPKTSDTDRLGTIGLGLGGPRGITVQIGGGGGGGLGGGLLPLGALGIVRNIVGTLLPRPTLGLNSKVFLGVEVGRGGGMGGGLLG